MDAIFDRSLLRNPLYFLGHNIARVGQRFSVDSLTYNPFIFWHFHRLARTDASAVVSAIEEVFADAKRIADVGSGSGAYAAEAQQRGKQVVACEHSPVGRFFARRQGVDCRRFDLRLRPPANIDVTFDLAYCFEVAEHVPAAMAKDLVTFLSSLAPTVLFTAAPPGQGGYGHINEQPREYWIELFSAAGMNYCGRRSAQIAERLRKQNVRSYWLAQNAMVFAK